MLRGLAVITLLPLLPIAAGSSAEAGEFVPIPGVEYYCTDSIGVRREIGEVICVAASCQTWMARCEMSLNNPMWRKVQDGCPAAGLLERFQELDEPSQSVPVKIRV